MTRADADDPDDGDENAGGIVPDGKASGYRHMAAKPGALQFRASSVGTADLPNKVDLRPLMTPIEDQGDTSSCVAHAVAGAFDYWIRKAARVDQSVSRLFVYYNARWRDGSQDKDEGSVIQLAMEGLSSFGACDEKIWPFDKSLLFRKPGADAYKDAADYRVHDKAQVPLELDVWKQALAEGKPIVFGCELFKSFDRCSERGGVVPMPAPRDVARAKHSGHAMCAVGYSDSEKVFIVRNSWGEEWGDKGYCYMPYAYLMSSTFNDGDCWVFVPKVPLPPPHDVWSDSTAPVTNGGEGVDFDIETYSVEDYERLAIDLFEEVRQSYMASIPPDYRDTVTAIGKRLWSELESLDTSGVLARITALATAGDHADTKEPAEDASPADAAEPDEASPDATEPDEAEPEAPDPDEAEPDATEPDEAEPDAPEPDAPEPDADVDVEAILDELQEKSDEELDWRNSTVDLLKTLGHESNRAARRQLAEDLDYDGDTDDTAAMNTWLHAEILKKLAENGGQLPDDL